MVLLNEAAKMSTGTFDSSDEDIEEGNVDISSLQIDWLDLSSAGCPESLGICPLPGCKFKDIRRNLEADIEHLKQSEVKDVFVLCTHGELHKYRVPRLMQEYTQAEIVTHHYPFPDGSVPNIGCLLKMLDSLRVCMENKRTTVLHCYGGLGRSCFVAACLILQLDASTSPEAAIERVRQLKGAGAIQTVKQYNFVYDFRKLAEEYEKNSEGIPRTLSR